MSKYNSFSIDTDDFLPSSSTPRPAETQDMMLEGRRTLRNLASIRLDRIISRPQVREEFDEDALNELADSLKSKGQQQPIRVRWDAEAEGDGRYIILQGERRFRASKIAGLETIDCVVHSGELTDAEITELQLIENIVREQLNAIEEAKAFKKIIEDRKAAGLEATAKAIAKEIGYSETKVQRAVRLLTLPEDIQNEVAEGVIPPTVIREVVKIKDEAQQREMLDAYKNGGTREEIAATVKMKKSCGKGAASTGPKTKKAFTAGGIKLQATAKKRVTQAEIAEALELWLADIRNDGRSKAA